MVPIQGRVFFKPLPDPITDDGQGHPYHQQDERKQDGKQSFDGERPWAITEKIDPEDSSSSAKDKQRKHCRDKKAGDAEQQGI